MTSLVASGLATAVLLLATLAGVKSDTNPTPDPGVYQVLRALPKTKTQFDFIVNFWKQATKYNLDFWKAPSKIGAYVDIMVPSTTNAEVQHLLQENNIKYQITIQDVERLIELREKKPERSSFGPVLRDSVIGSKPSYNFRRYGSYDKMLTYMEAVEKAYPGIATIIDLGKTHENRTIKTLKIGYPVKNTNKRAVWIDGGIHAREWAAPHTALYFIEQLVSQYDKDPAITQYVNSLNIFITPVVNPDGYEYTRTSVHPQVRLWRKNRSPAISSNCDKGLRTDGCCRGVDLNRNFDFHWSEAGSSSNECSAVYHGQRPFSEPESEAVRRFVLSNQNKGKIDAFITLHTYSQLWIHPYGHLENNYPGDVNELLKLGQKAARALRSVNGKQFVVGSGADTLYPASGGSDDWAKSRANIKYVYLLELRPEERIGSSRHHMLKGFLLSQSELLPVAQETWAGVQVVIDQVANPDHINDPLPEEIPYRFGNPGVWSSCYDLRVHCKVWARRLGGLICRSNIAAMSIGCAKSCGYCAGRK